MRNLLLSACLLAGPAALAATMASQPWVTNRIAEAVAAIPSPDFTTNNAALVETIEAKAPAPGNYATVSNRAMTAMQSHQSLQPSTNYTDAALAAFASTGAVFRAATYGTPTRWTDATGCVWEVTTGWRVYTNGVVAAGWTAWDYAMDSTEEGTYWALMIGLDIDAGGLTYSIAEQMLPSGTAPHWPPELTNIYNSDVDYNGLTGGDAIRAVRGGTNLVGRVAMTSDIPDVSGFATAEYADSAASAAVEPVSDLVETVREESALVYRLYQGSNVVAEVTNYNSSVHAPELRIMQLNESNEYFTVWAEANGLARTLASARQYTDDATNALPAKFAPRAWGRTTAGMGVEAPSNTTWLSTAKTVIAGGLDFEKHVTSGGAIWLLEANGMVADFHAQTNNTAFLDIANADGTPIFRVEKTDSFLVGVHIDAVTVEGDALVCSVGVVAAEHPLVRVRASLSSGEWIKEEDGIPAALATVTWSGSTGNWTCRIRNNTGGGQFFAQMEYLQEGGTKIVNSAPMSVSAGILCTDGIHKCRPVYSNGSITWEVVP